jgi:HSP20 family protein
MYQPDLDIQEKEDAYLVRMDLPGMQKDQIQIDVTDKSLTISGERRVQSEEDNVRKGYYRMERSFGSFHRTIPLEGEIKTGEVSAKYGNGVLEVTLPKVDPQKPSSKSVKIQ